MGVNFFSRVFNGIFERVDHNAKAQSPKGKVQTKPLTLNSNYSAAHIYINLCHCATPCKMVIRGHNQTNLNFIHNCQTG